MLLFKCEPVVNAAVKVIVINILWLHLLTSILTYSHTSTLSSLSHFCLASRAAQRLDAEVSNAHCYSLVLWPKGEMKNHPVVLILKTLILASSAAMATSCKTISGFVGERHKRTRWTVEKHKL